MIDLLAGSLGLVANTIGGIGQFVVGNTVSAVAATALTVTTGFFARYAIKWLWDNFKVPEEIESYSISVANEKAYKIREFMLFRLGNGKETSEILGDLDKIGESVKRAWTDGLNGKRYRAPR